MLRRVHNANLYSLGLKVVAYIQGGAKETGPAYLIANIMKIP